MGGIDFLLPLIRGGLRRGQKLDPYPASPLLRGRG